MSRKMNRRDFVLTGASAAGLAAAGPGAAFGRAPAIQTSSVKPVVIASGNGNRSVNEANDTCVALAFRKITDGEDVLDALIAGARLAADSIVSTGGAASVERESAAALEGMLAMLALRDSEVYEHAYRVSALSMEMARVMGVSASGAMLVERAALLHDIGWTAPLPGRSTYEPLPTNASERESICALEQGGAILDGLWPYLAGTADILRAMPEWFAGPEARNTDEAIPLGSRIVAVADAYDTLVSSPGGAVSPMDALADVQRLSGTRFDPQVVKALGVTLFGRN